MNHRASNVKAAKVKLTANSVPVFITKDPETLQQDQNQSHGITDKNRQDGSDKTITTESSATISAHSITNDWQTASHST